MNGLSLRKATDDDSEFAYQVKRAAFREYAEQVWGWDEDQQRRFHAERFASQDFRIISVGGSDVGVMAVVVAADCLNVNQLFILREFQGKGIGRECMLRVMNEASKLCLPVRLGVLKVNPRALAFYERLGFCHCGQTQTHHMMEKSWK